jgi:NAD(P)-dependent dehydrogenase (short-subunit alcohol dehydrogenase family)
MYVVGQNAAMALNATIFFKFTLNIADLDRHYYADHALTIARHPSETNERMMVRLLAFTLHASDRLEFGRGISSVSDAAFDAAMAVNFKHYFFVAQALADGMKALGGGAMVNISSETALNGHPDLPVYAAAKGACLSLTRSQARVWGKTHNIRVNAVVPGWVRTERQIDKSTNGSRP